MSNPEPTSTDGAGRFERVLQIAASDETLVVLGLLTAEVFVLLGYFGLTGAQVTALRYAVYPFVWIDVGLLAAWKVRLAPSTVRRRRIAGLVAAGYFLVVAYAGGLFGPPGPDAFGLSVRLLAGSPGYAPVVAFDNGLIHVVLLPYKLVGYLALAYLVFATAIDAAGSAASGLLGLLSCVSCTWPVLTSVLAGIAGSTALVTSEVMAYSLDLSTLVFVVTVALLYWRPGFGD